MTCEIHNSFLWFEELYGYSIKEQVIREESTNHMLEKSFRGVKAQPQWSSRHALGYIHAQMGSAQSPLQQTAVYNQGRGGRVKKNEDTDWTPRSPQRGNKCGDGRRNRLLTESIEFNRSTQLLPVQFTGTRQHEYRLPPVPEDWL